MKLHESESKRCLETSKARKWSPEVSKSEPKDSHWSQKGAKREPKGSQKGAKREPKGAQKEPKGGKREPKGAQSPFLAKVTFLLG